MYKCNIIYIKPDACENTKHISKNSVKVYSNGVDEITHFPSVESCTQPTKTTCLRSQSQEIMM